MSGVYKTILPTTVDLNQASVTGGVFGTGQTSYITSLYGYRGILCAVCGYNQEFEWSGHGAINSTHTFVALNTNPFHTGLDMTIYPIASGVYPLRAMFAGVVIWSDKVNDADGYSVGVQGFDTHTVFNYLHLSNSPLVSVGDHVCAGMILGYMGTTGYSTGPHLHLELYIDWVHFDPLPFLWGTRDEGELVGGSAYFDEFGHYHDEFGYYL